MLHRKTEDLRPFPLPHASMFWKFIKNWEAYLWPQFCTVGLRPYKPEGVEGDGQPGVLLGTLRRKMPQSVETCFRGMWSVHRMSCILLAVCLRNLFIYSASVFFFFFEALLLPAPPLIRYSFTWPRHMVDVPHRSSRGKNGSYCLTERQAPCLPPLNSPHSPR